jgi:hypothetical protein
MKLRVFKFLVGMSLCVGSLALSSQAHAWTKVFDCSGSNAVIDRETPVAGPEGFQIVFRNQDMIGQLLQSGAVDIKRLTSLNEIVLILNQNPTTPGEWIGEADAFYSAGIVYFVRAAEETVVFEAFRTTQTSSQGYIVLDKVGSWRLKDCHRPQSVLFN